VSLLTSGLSCTYWCWGSLCPTNSLNTTLRLRLVCVLNVSDILPSQFLIPSKFTVEYLFMSCYASWDYCTSLIRPVFSSVRDKTKTIDCSYVTRNKLPRALWLFISYPTRQSSLLYCYAVDYIRVTESCYSTGMLHGPWRLTGCLVLITLHVVLYFPYFIRQEGRWTASVVYWSEFLAADPEVPGSIPNAIRFSEK
jgi:hypothetical protein